MKSDKTKEQLLEEVEELENRVFELEKNEIKLQNRLEALKKSEEKYKAIVGKFLNLSNEMIMAINKK